LAAAAVEAALGHDVYLSPHGRVLPYASYSLVDYLTAYGLCGAPPGRRISLVLGKELVSRVVFYKFELASGETIELDKTGDTVTPQFHPDELLVAFLLMKFDSADQARRTIDSIDRYIQIRDGDA
jgi:hypothetical protein